MTKKYIYKDKPNCRKKYLTRLNMNFLCRRIIPDFRDSALISMAWDGVLHNQGLDWVVNLKKDDLTGFKHQAKLLGQDVGLSTRTANLLLQSKKETYIHTFRPVNLGYGVGLDKLVEGDYMFRVGENTLKRIKEGKYHGIESKFNGEAMTTKMVEKRMVLLKNVLGLDFTYHSLYSSGLLSRAFAFYGNKDFTQNDFVKFCEVFYGKEGRAMRYMYKRVWIDGGFRNKSLSELYLGQHTSEIRLD